MSSLMHWSYWSRCKLDGTTIICCFRVAWDFCSSTYLNMPPIIAIRTIIPRTIIIPARLEHGAQRELAYIVFLTVLLSVEHCKQGETLHGWSRLPCCSIRLLMVQAR